MKRIEKLIKKENFTSTESSLADYIINNIDSVYRMSLQDLAKASYVSKPSVIRLYRKVGCSNYREFSIALQLERIRSGSTTNFETNQAFMESGSLYEFVKKLGVLSKQIVDNCINSIEKSTLENIVHALDQAETIFLYPVGDVDGELVIFTKQIEKIGKNVVSVKGKKNLKINKGDAVLILADVQDIHEDETLSFIESSDAVKILVTTMDDPEHKVAFDHCFYTYPNGSDLIRINPLVSQMSLLWGLNIINSCMLKMKNDEGKQG